MTAAPIGLGMARLSFGPVDHTAVAATVETALAGGVRLFDTARAYSPDPDDPAAAERLLASALGDADGVMVATKGGSTRVSLTKWKVDGRGDALRDHCETSLMGLGADCMDLYQLHWPDPDVPLLESVGALAELRDEGKIRLVGLSNVSVEQLDAAEAVTRIDAVQNKFGAHDPSDRPVIDWCEARGAMYLAYEPLGGSLAPVLGERVPWLGQLAAESGVSAPQAALAWVLAQSPCVIPLVGSTRPETLAAALDACRLELQP